MRLFCLGNPMGLIKLTYSPRFLENLPYIGTPILGKLPISRITMHDAYEESAHLTLCRTLEEANELRHAKIMIGNTNITPEFYRGAIAKGYPLADYAIYEIEVDDATELPFILLRDAPWDALERLISQPLYSHIRWTHDRAILPAIAIYETPKAALTHRLIQSHYLSLIDGPDGPDRESPCTVM